MGFPRNGHMHDNGLGSCTKPGGHNVADITRGPKPVHPELGSQTLAPLATTCRNDGATSNGAHTGAEAVLLGATTGVRLESTLGHLDLFKLRGRTRVRA